MPDDPDYRFRGFRAPNFTPVPDELFDEIAPKLTEAELRVLLYIIRRTFGFKKDTDDISLSQLVEGITAKDGRVLDAGTGVSRSTAVRAVKGLIIKQIITATRRSSPEKGNEPTTYALRFVEDGWFYDRTRGGAPIELGVVSPQNPQETVEQETVEQETVVESSNGPDPHFDRARSVLVDYVADFAREFHDQASLTASTTRAVALYRRSGLGLEAFVEVLYQARATTKERSAAIRAAPVGNGAMPAKPKMAYFFAVLEDLLERARGGR